MPVVAVLHHLARPFLGHVAVLREAGVTLDERHVAAGDPLPDLAAVAGIVTLGGEQSVTDPDAEPWMPGELALLREAAERDVPVLGICLGGQLLAAALGARVRHAGRLIGWRDVRPTAAGRGDPLIAALPDPAPALHFNEDVFELPDGAVAVLEGEPGAPGVEAFRAGRRAWGLQYHPDADAAAVGRWIDAYPEWIEQAGADPVAIREESERRAGAQARASRALFEAFARLSGA